MDQFHLPRMLNFLIEVKFTLYWELHWQITQEHRSISLRQIIFLLVKMTMMRLEKPSVLEMLMEMEKMIFSLALNIVVSRTKEKSL